MNDRALDDDELEELEERQTLWRTLDNAFERFRDAPEPSVRGDHPLADDVREALAGKRWQDLGADELRTIRLDLRRLTPPAFWWVFRAVARQVLVSDDPVDGLAEAAIAVLTPVDEPTDEDVTTRRALLDSAQRTAVREFVMWYSEGESHLPGRERLLAAWSLPAPP